MKKINILKSNEDFNRIINNEKYIKYKDYVIYYEKTNDKIYKFGFSVGKKIGNAVTRNKIKRQLKYIVDKKDYKNNFNCIIMVRKSILKKEYNEMNSDLFYVFNKLDILKEEN